MRKALFTVGALAVLFAALAVGLAVRAAAVGSVPCVKPTTLMFFSEQVPAFQQLELQARDAVMARHAIRQGAGFGGELLPTRTEPGVISGAVIFGNGKTESPFGTYYLGVDVVYGFTATRACDGGGWTLTLGRRFARHKPAPGYRPDGRAGRPADPGR